MADFTAPRVWANLGVNGIDGLISTARGISVGLDTPIIAMLGDIAFLHDHNGLLSSPFESQPDVTFVVVDDNGGAIFSDLEQGAPEFAPWFERVFGTPHGHDLAAMSRALGIPTTVVTTASELDAALATPQGLSVVVVKAASRESSHEFRMSLRNGATYIAHAAE
jgi:2-succinyl-5-enolpyruvyl-6-hydroxy-3-cyclohexene-1-carboxylate synthase